MNAPNIDAIHRVKANEQHQVVTKLAMQKETTSTSTTHQVTPQTLTQLLVVSVQCGGNHELIQQFDEGVSIQQQWHLTTPIYFILIIGVPTPINNLFWYTKTTTKPEHGFGTH